MNIWNVIKVIVKKKKKKKRDVWNRPHRLMIEKYHTTDACGNIKGYFHSSLQACEQPRWKTETVMPSCFRRTILCNLEINVWTKCLIGEETSKTTQAAHKTQHQSMKSPNKAVSILSYAHHVKVVLSNDALVRKTRFGSCKENDTLTLTLTLTF